ncbi:MAG: ATP-binding protein, partial [Aquirufa sp.]
ILRRQNDDGISFSYGDIERFLLDYVRHKGQITLADLVQEAKIPTWLAARKLVLLVLARVLKIEPGESFDTYRLN